MDNVTNVLEIDNLKTYIRLSRTTVQAVSRSTSLPGRRSGWSANPAAARA
jgi:hypothetical protein